MNYYPVLASKMLDSEVRLYNFPPDYYGRNTYSKVVSAYSARSNGLQWNIRRECKLKPGESIHFKHLAGDLQPVFYFMSSKEYGENLPLLPIEEGFQETDQISWRATLALESKFSRACYQGDYPEGMLRTEKETLVSISPLIQTEVNMVNRIFLVNLKRKPLNNQKIVYLSDLKSREIVGKFIVHTNQCNEIDLAGLDLNTRSYYYLHSNEITGIPIYFSADVELRDMSIEHSHPPDAMQVFGERDQVRDITKKMKRWWIDHAIKTLP